MVAMVSPSGGTTTASSRHDLSTAAVGDNASAHGKSDDGRAERKGEENTLRKAVRVSRCSDAESAILNRSVGSEGAPDRTVSCELDRIIESEFDNALTISNFEGVFGDSSHFENALGSGLATSFTDGQKTTSNYFESRLQAKMMKKLNSFDETVEEGVGSSKNQMLQSSEWDPKMSSDRPIQGSMTMPFVKKSSTFATPDTAETSPRTVTRESFEDRVKKKMNNSLLPKLPNEKSAQLKAKVSFEDRLLKKIDNGSITARDSYEERLKKKMNYISITKPATRSEQPKAKYSYEERLKKKLSGSLTKPASGPGELKANDSYEERLKKKLSGSLAKPATRSEQPKATDSYEERLKKKMNNRSITKPATRPGELKANDSYEERLKKKLSGSLTKPVSRPGELESNDSYEERLKKKLSGSLAKPATRPEQPKANDSYEERLKKKLSGSLAKPATRSEQLKANDSYEERLKKKLNGSLAKLTSRPEQPKATDSYEERLKKKVDGSLAKPSNIDIARDSYEDRLKRKMNASVIVPSSNIASSSVNGKRSSAPDLITERKIVPITSSTNNTKDSYEDRLKRKMNGASAAPSTNNARDSYEDRLKRKMNSSGTVPSSNIASSSVNGKRSSAPDLTTERKIAHAAPSTNNARDSYEERLKRKMNESCTAPSTNNAAARDSYEERLKRKMNSSGTVPSSNIAASSGDGKWRSSAPDLTTEREIAPTHIQRAQNLKAGELFEDRLKRKMEACSAVTSSNCETSSVEEGTINVAIVDSIVLAGTTEQKIKAREMFEERLQRKFEASATIPYTSSVKPSKSDRTSAEVNAFTCTKDTWKPKRGDKFEERLKRKMEASRTITSSNSETSSVKEETRDVTAEHAIASTGTKEAWKLKRGETFEDRLKRKMEASSTTTSSNSETSSAKGEVKGAAAIHLIASTGTKEAQKLKGGKSFEERLKKKTESSSPTATSRHSAKEAHVRKKLNASRKGPSRQYSF